MRPFLKIPPLAFGLFFCGFLAFNGRATTYYVNQNNPNPVLPFTTWATAATNIQNAASKANGGDTILVTNGIYQYGGLSLDGLNRVYVENNNVTVQSVNGPAVTTIVGYQLPGTTNGANAVRCVYLSSGSTLSGFTLTNGATVTDGSGGGVYCYSTNCTVTNCIITGNAAYDGGGGAYSGTLINCQLIGNAATGLNVGAGGAAYGSTLINCLLTGNSGTYIAGAVYISTLVNCTIVSNAGGVGAGAFKNCIIYYNLPNDSVTDCTNCCISSTNGIAGLNNITNAPDFVNLSSGNFQLQPSSPCINAGNNSFVTISNDLAGNPRIVGGIVDLGAYEFQSPIHYVAISNTAPVSPFTNWVTAATNIQDAIDAANPGDFILVSNGIYSTGGRVVYGTLTNRVVVDKPVTVQSVNGAMATNVVVLVNRTNLQISALTEIQGNSILGNNAVRCVYLTNGAALIGFVLTNGGTLSIGGISGDTNGSGGAIWCESSNATISNCILIRNDADWAGGAAYQGTLNNCMILDNMVVNLGGGGSYFAELNNCLIAGNSSDDWGGGALGGILVECILTNNSASYGGGVVSNTLFNCTLIGNEASYFGGGAYQSSLTGCIVASNSANFGGGVYCGELNNCLLAGNSASGGGAVEANVYSAPTILNLCTVSGNSASTEGGGLLSIGVAAPSYLFVTNSIVYGNSAPMGSNYLFGFPTELTFNYCCTAPLPTYGAGNISSDPAFVNSAGGNYQLQSTSPCINSGNNAGVTSATDLDGNPRIVGGTVDIGCYEYQSPTSVISYAYLQQYGLPTDGSVDYADLDGTAFNVYQDWVTGLNPTNPASILAMLTPTATNNANGITVTWQSVSGIFYNLQRSTNFLAQPAFSTIQANITGQPGTTSYTDTTATNNAPYFYRVGVIAP
jgi:hypothetical protein